LDTDDDNFYTHIITFINTSESEAQTFSARPLGTRLGPSTYIEPIQFNLLSLGMTAYSESFGSFVA